MSTLRGDVLEDPRPHVDLVKTTRPWTSSQWYNEMRLLGEGCKLWPERQKKQVIMKKFWLHFSAVIGSTILELRELGACGCGVRDGLGGCYTEKPKRNKQGKEAYPTCPWEHTFCSCRTQHRLYRIMQRSQDYIPQMTFAHNHVSSEMRKVVYYCGKRFLR